MINETQFRTGAATIVVVAMALTGTLSTDMAGAFIAGLLIPVRGIIEGVSKPLNGGDKK
jgi:hypothetical protein